MAVRAVVGQQITVIAARTLMARLAGALGKPVESPFPGVSSTFPLAGDICALEGPIEELLGPLGITSRRARTIRNLAEALQSGTITLSPHGDPAREMEKLLALPGIGPWTVQYLAMRALAWPDAFPDTDHGVKKALAKMTPGQILPLSREWSPWRSYATITLWNALQKGILGSVHPETPDETLSVSDLETRDFSSWQENQGIARRRTSVRRTSKPED
jgi:AraC family transcriptional regulator of adaptative response / DNA-3-methyladenine glycosylase II